MSDNKIINQVNDYYSQKIITHGATPQGVDWNSAESQNLRFKQLLKLIDTRTPFSLLDYGCGFGSLLEFIKQEKYNCDYSGFDVSLQMIAEAKKIHPYVNWLTQKEELKVYDFTIASGIFNVRLDNSNENWLHYILETLNEMNRISKKGFSFNVLTTYSDKEFMKDYLYYADPGILFDYCKINFSKYVSLLHDYPLYEFTILVKKEI